VLGDRLVHWHVDDPSARLEKLLATGATEQSPRRRVDAPLVQALADVATIGLFAGAGYPRQGDSHRAAAGTLNSRIVIEQAKGAVAQWRGVDVDEAFNLIRDYARGNQRRLSEVVQAVLTDPGDVPEITGKWT
jgi:hypothetical protein